MYFWSSELNLCSSYLMLASFFAVALPTSYGARKSGKKATEYWFASRWLLIFSGLHSQ